jgi:hypothetical protein
MSLSRRAFVNTVGAGTVAVLGGRILGGGRIIGPWTRGFEEALEAAQAAAGQPILLHNNENPLGPGEKAIAAMRAKLTEKGYPAARYGSLAPDLAALIAKKYGCKPENVMVGLGSTQILRAATFAFTSPSKGLVAGSPTYEECADVARLVGAPIKTVPGTSTLHHDIDGMVAAAKGAGLIFFDNPSNPGATLHPATAVATFAERVLRDSPETTILFDEAYHDYVTDPAHKTQIPLALENPRVVVARTFSKAYGWRGSVWVTRSGGPRRCDPCARRSSAAQPTCSGSRLRRVHRGRREARTGKAAQHRGSPVHDRLVQEGRLRVHRFAVQLPLRQDRQDREGIPRGVRRGQHSRRPRLPPFEKTHARISIGTLEEMKQAVRCSAKSWRLKPPRKKGKGKRERNGRC